MDGTGHVINVAGVDPTEGDAAGLQEVEMLLNFQPGALLRAQASVGKHACILEIELFSPY